MDEAIDEGDDAGGVGEDLAPSSEGLVGGEEDGGVCGVAPGDDLEEEVCVSLMAGEVSNLIDAQELGCEVGPEPALERGGGVGDGEVGEEGCGGGEADGEALKDGVVGEVLGEEGLAGAVGSNEDDVGALAEEVEGEEVVDEGAVEVPGPGPARGAQSSQRRA